MPTETSEAEKGKAQTKKAAKKDPTIVLLEQLSAKMDGIVDMAKENSGRIDVLESTTDVLKDMMREDAPVLEDFQPLKPKEYPDDVILAIAREKMEWHTVVPLRTVENGITINGFTVPFRKGVRMEIPTSWRDDAVRRGEAQENPII